MLLNWKNSIPKTPLSSNLTPDKRLPSKATNDFLNVHEYVRPGKRHCESYTVKFRASNFPENGNNDFDGQHIVSELGFLKTAENAEEWRRLDSNHCVERVQGSDMHKCMENLNSYTGVVQGARYMTSGVPYMLNVKLRLFELGQLLDLPKQQATFLSGEGIEHGNCSKLLILNYSIQLLNHLCAKHKGMV